MHFRSWSGHLSSVSHCVQLVIRAAVTAKIKAKKLRGLLPCYPSTSAFCAVKTSEPCSSLLHTMGRRWSWMWSPPPGTVFMDMCTNAIKQFGMKLALHLSRIALSFTAPGCCPLTMILLATAPSVQHASHMDLASISQDLSSCSVTCGIQIIPCTTPVYLCTTAGFHTISAFVSAL